MTRRWREWWAKVRLVCSLHELPAPGKKLLFPEFAEILRSLQPELSPYEGLAKIWDDYARGLQMDYPAFIKAMARSRRLSLRSALDLACGSGTLTARLAKVVPQVVGLDSSPAMLAEARSRYSGVAGVQFISGDFRGFHLGQEFDVAVCAFNSLNYVADVNELGAVFRSVAAHLGPAGLFVFDTVTEAAMQFTSGRYRHVEVDGTRFVIRFDYDPQTRRETSVAALSHGVESHRRIPLGPEEVRAAAQESGLEVDSWFSDIPVPGVCEAGPACFFVLTRTSSAKEREKEKRKVTAYTTHYPRAALACGNRVITTSPRLSFMCPFRSGRASLPIPPAADRFRQPSRGYHHTRLQKAFIHVRAQQYIFLPVIANVYRVALLDRFAPTNRCPTWGMRPKAVSTRPSATPPSRPLSAVRAKT